MLNYDEEKESISNENISIIIKENILLSFQERQGDIFDPVRERIRKQKKLIRNSGTDYLAFALLDVIIDNYIHVISRIGEKIELIRITSYNVCYTKLLRTAATHIGAKYPAAKLQQLILKQNTLLHNCSNSY